MKKYDKDGFVENSNVNFGKNIESLQKGLLETALCHRQLILTTIIISAALGLIYLLTARRIYTASARLYVEQTGPKLITDLTPITGDSKNYLYTQRELIRSTPIVASVAENKQLRNNRTLEHTDNVVAFVKKKLEVTVGKKDDIITISFDSPYPQEAAQIVNAVVDGYVEYHTTHKKGTVLEVLKILQKEKSKRDQELSDQTAQMLEFSQKNGLLAISDSSTGNVVFQRYSKLSDALTAAQLQTINALAEYEAVVKMRELSSRIRQYARARSAESLNPVIKERETQLQSQLTALEGRLDELLLNCTEIHPSVKAVKNRIETVRKELNEQDREFADAFVEILYQKYLTAKETENQLSKSCDQQQQIAQDAGVKTTEYSILNSQIKRTERLCEILDQRIKELNVAEDTGALNISILEFSRTPESPSKPQKAKVLTFALFCGLLASFGLVLVREQFDNRLHSSEEVTAVLNLPVLGIIPNISRQQKGPKNIKDLWQKSRLRIQRILGIMSTAFAPAKTRTNAQAGSQSSSASSPAAMLAQKLGKTGTETNLKTTILNTENPVINTGQTAAITDYVQRGQKVRLHPKSIAAEAYRTIRTSIFFGVPKGQAKTILVTSPTAGDGKSTLVSNLGLAMAQAGQKTIIIDCDFRKPMQHNIFELSRQTGLSNCITQNTSLDNCIQKGPIENIDVLACGADVPNPSELLNSEVFTKILNELSNRYDRILIDSPPVMPVADSQILGAISDITIVVLRAEKSTKKISRTACETLTGVGSHLLGTVINDVPQPKGRYGYYHYHNYGYRNYGYRDYGYYETKEQPQQAEKVYS